MNSEKEMQLKITTNLKCDYANVECKTIMPKILRNATNSKF